MISDKDRAAMVDIAAIRRKALFYLSRREHAQKELIQKLTQAGYDFCCCQEVLNDLAASDWQSDSRYADWLIRYRSSKGDGPYLLRQRLDNWDIDSYIYEPMLSSVNWLDGMHVLWSRRSRMHGEGVDEQVKQRNYFWKKGYSSDLIELFFSNISD